jgi:hypothetical protein
VAGANRLSRHPFRQEPWHIALIGIVPFDLDPGLELSGAIADKTDEMVELVAGELRSHGFTVESAA